MTRRLRGLAPRHVAPRDVASEGFRGAQLAAAAAAAPSEACTDSSLELGEVLPSSASSRREVGLVSSLVTDSSSRRWSATWKHEVASRVVGGALSAASKTSTSCISDICGVVAFNRGETGMMSFSGVIQEMRLCGRPSVGGLFMQLRSSCIADAFSGEPAEVSVDPDGEVGSSTHLQMSCLSSVLPDRSDAAAIMAAAL